MRPVIGLDIGGANLKAAHTSGAAVILPFELFRHPDRLAPALREIMALLPAAEALAVTMTGELCDAFATRREGVAAILDAVTASATLPVLAWQTNGQFTDVDSARADPWRTASANWLALATFAGRLAPAGSALVLDVGSTTTDIIPLLEGIPCPQGHTDPDRLHSGELVYTGVRRTPLCALLGDSVAAELFATTLDVHLTLGSIDEDESDVQTADGRPATRVCAHARLARMLLEDAESCSAQATEELARACQQRQLDMIDKAIRQVTARLPGAVESVIVSGSGEFLARSVCAGLPGTPRIHSLVDTLGPSVSAAACAYAVALLASADAL